MGPTGVGLAGTLKRSRLLSGYARNFFSRQRRCRSDAGFRFLFLGMAVVYHFVGARPMKR
jgi:hypothetical protein